MQAQDEEGDRLLSPLRVLSNLETAAKLQHGTSPGGGTGAANAAVGSGGVAHR